MDLSVKIGRKKIKNPIIIASGVLGNKPSLYLRAWQQGAGSIVTKTFTYEARSGYKTPIIIKIDCGYINAVGLENPGIGGIKDTIRFLKKNNVNFIVSIAGKDHKEFLKLAEKAYNSGADSIELNMSCPHAKRLGLELGVDPDIVKKIVRTIKDTLDIEVFPKFGYFPNIVQVAKLAEIAGADGVVAINTIRSMKIDIWIKKPILSNKFGGLSGPAIHPISVATIYSLYEVLDIPIIASGGVWNWEDAIEFFLAGATAVQIGSIIGERGLNVIQEILEGIEKYLEQQNHSSIKEIVGLAHQ